MALTKLRFFTLFTLLVCNFGCHDAADKAATPVQNSTPGVAFLKDCKAWKEVSSGSLQGLDYGRKGSAKNLCFSSDYTQTIPCEIVFIYKASVEKRNELGNDSISSDFFHGCRNLFADFDCYAFVHPRQDPDKLDDIHGDKNVYPVTVKVYKRVKDDQWLYLREAKVDSFPQLSDLKFRTIYGL